MGVVLVDKPSGPTSRETAARVARTLCARKAGHSGTLDANVTGVLVVAVGPATRAIEVFVGHDKEYVGAFRLAGDVEPEPLEAARRRFLGVIVQTPPPRARVVRRPRERTVHRWLFTEVEGREVRFICRCQAGTYVRTLISDLGEALGVGAEMTELRRTQAGPFRIEECTPLAEIGPGDLRPLGWALDRAGLARVVLGEAGVVSLTYGKPFAPTEAKSISADLSEGDVVGLYDQAGAALALGRLEQGAIVPFRNWSRSVTGED